MRPRVPPLARTRRRTFLARHISATHKCSLRLFPRGLRLWEPLAPNRSGGASRVATFTLPHEEENGETHPKVPLCSCLLTLVVNSSARMSPGLYISQSVEMWALIPKTKKAAKAPASTWPDLPKLRRRQVLCNSAHCWDLAGLGL